jgi:hypothetical protein
MHQYQIMTGTDMTVTTTRPICSQTPAKSPFLAPHAWPQSVTSAVAPDHTPASGTFVQVDASEAAASDDVPKWPRNALSTEMSAIRAKVDSETCSAIHVSAQNSSATFTSASLANAYCARDAPDL